MNTYSAVSLISLFTFTAFANGGGVSAEGSLRLKPAAIITIPGARLSSISYSDTRNEIYAVDMQTGDILVSGVSSRRFDKLEVRGELDAYAITVGEDDFLFVTDLYGPGVTKITPAGDIVGRIEVDPGEASGPCLGRIRKGPVGVIYAVERSGSRIFRFDEGLESVEVIHLESSPKPLAIVDVTFGAGGTILVLSSKGQVIRKFDASGKYLGGYGIHSTDESAFSLPSAIAKGPDGNLWIVDSFQHTIKVYSEDGGFLCSLLDMDVSGSGFYFPVDIAFVSMEGVAVLDKGSSSLKFFDAEGF